MPSSTKTAKDSSVSSTTKHNAHIKVPYRGISKAVKNWWNLLIYKDKEHSLQTSISMSKIRTVFEIVNGNLPASEPT